MNLNKAAELWLGEHIPTTRKSYRQPTMPFIDYIGPARPIESIATIHTVEYFQQVITPKNLKPNTYNKHVKTLRTFFNWCVRMELIDKSPMRVVKMKKVPTGINRSKAMTDAEFADLVDHARHHPQQLALLLFVADSACRRGGAAGLRVGDIDWVNNRATVTEKGNKTRTVSFGEDAGRAIRRWLDYRGIKFRVTGVYVFSQTGVPMRAENISLILRRMCEKAGIRTLSAHSLRFRKGFAMADAKIAPSLTGAYLGHDDKTITLKHYYPDDYESAETLAKQFNADTRKLRTQARNILDFDRSKSG